MPPVSRRNMLKATGGLTTFALAGCLGNGDSSGDSDGNGGDSNGGGGGTTSIGVGIPSATTTSGSASNSLQRVIEGVSGETEPAGEIRWNNQETGGDPPSLRQYNQGNVQAMTSGNFVIASALQDAPPFSERPVEEIPHQLFSLATLHMHILAIDGSGIETTDDLVGKNLWPLPPQWGLRSQAEVVLQNAGLWSELQDSGSIVNADTGQVAGRIEEGSADALISYGSGFANLPGWATEVDARAALHPVEWTDSFIEGANSTRGTTHSEIEAYGWENQDFNGDNLDVYGADFQFFLSPSISRDVGYELARISHENTGSIQDGQPAYRDHSDPETMASLFLEDHPVHAGPYDFLEEQGVDMSAYTRGEVQG
ncbi:TAXI family TRAP transporter solute-binding subunit [Haloarcula sp. H-GB4]|uniref:TAXI family TRAP transporter solute-binding subunit n=1 Tax=Haloarcula sp. H-GB4 TaxID=3069755 RepID=UPI0027B58E18|nr:TAXI family TRAP transporter solute-binding subunit [Haloarcula sp. H-GB4]MDQ2074516.1 TAXI family TRAP transporter solute-binding subunit [Haloarcula sp. H-GB4]